MKFVGELVKQIKQGIKNFNFPLNFQAFFAIFAALMAG
jgi:hypothetical protein